MKLYQVSLNSINMVKQFIDVTTVQDCEIDVLSGRYVVDGKSIMALFSIDLNRPVNVRFHGSEEESQQFLAQAQAEGLTIVEIAEL
ncbi:MAG: HPr family phosphocarrier protein [Oscillospiraceae bacterium]|nr:HPr family phosphocarrier protein [Oscillospiraceae bacterium]